MGRAPGGRGPDGAGGSGRGISRRRALRITAVAGIGAALGGGLVRALLERAGLRRVSRTRTQLGTRVEVAVVHADRDEALAMVEAAFAEIERLEGLLSRHRPDTPVRRLARDGALPDPPPELVEILTTARALSERTDGAFDVTAAPLVDLYRGRDGLPTRREIEAALARVGYRDLRVEPDAVLLDRPGMALTLDGIAKGYVVDRTLAVLVGAGAGRVLVEAGGDLATVGSDLGGGEGAGGSGTGERTDRGGWRVAIQDPRDPAGVLDVRTLRGGGMASSGDYVQHFTRDLRHHHILDPRTGVSPEHTAAVTVTAPTAMDADALSTAAFVLGPEGGLALLAETTGVEGLIVAKDGSRVATAGLSEMVSETVPGSV